MDQSSKLADARLIVRHHVVGDPTDLGMHAGSAQLLRAHRLPRCALHQIRPPQAHEAGPLDHDDHVGEGRQVCPARDAWSHDRRQLRNPQIATHDGVVIEDAGRSVLAGEHPTLVREIHTGGVNEVDDRNAATHGDLLGPEDLLDGLGPPRPCFDGGVVGHDHDLTAFNEAHSRHDARPGRPAIVLIVGNEEADLDPGAPGIEKARHAFTGRQLALFVLPFDAFRPAPLEEHRAKLSEFRPQLGQAARTRCGSWSFRGGIPGRGHVRPFPHAWRTSRGHTPRRRPWRSRDRTAARRPDRRGSACPPRE